MLPERREYARLRLGVVGAFADIIVGSGANDTLNGNGGDDALFGGLGTDTLKGNDGADRLCAKDGVLDTSVDGGPGTDQAVIDQAPPAAVTDPTTSVESLIASFTAGSFTCS